MSVVIRTDVYQCPDCRTEIAFFDSSKQERDNIHVCRSLYWDGEDYNMHSVVRENRGGPRRGRCVGDYDSNGNPIKKRGQ